MPPTVIPKVVGMGKDELVSHNDWQTEFHETSIVVRDIRGSSLVRWARRCIIINVPLQQAILLLALQTTPHGNDACIRVGSRIVHARG